LEYSILSTAIRGFSPAVRLVVGNKGQRGARWRAVLPLLPKIGCAPQFQNDGLRQANNVLRNGEPVKAPLVQAQRKHLARRR
jgi:hypothetical protein